jgi:hypothetical protein
VRFFEENENKEIIWQAYADFDEQDVHYQRGIAFRYGEILDLFIDVIIGYTWFVNRTPAYKNIYITEPVIVFFQLHRPSNDSYSEPRCFTYIPQEINGKTDIDKQS